MSAGGFGTVRLKQERRGDKREKHGDVQEEVRTMVATSVHASAENMPMSGLMYRLAARMLRTEDALGRDRVVFVVRHVPPAELVAVERDYRNVAGAQKATRR